MTTELPSSLRLLQVAPLPPPWSGIGVSVQHLLTSTPISRQATWLLNSSSGALPGDSRRPKTPTLRRIVRHARLTLELMRTVRQHRIHVVHLHGSSHDLSFIANGLTVIGARLTGARVVWQLHQDLAVVEFPGTTPLSRAVFASLMLAPHALVVLTEKDRTIATRFVDQTKVAVIPPACSTDMLSIPLKRPDRNFRVLYVGWLTQAKGIYDLLQVAQSVQQHLPQITFSILGTGSSNEETDRVRGLVERCGLKSHVNLCGVVTGEAKRKMFADAHVLFTPTYRDAFPLAVLEAMAAGLPVLGTNVGGIPFMVDHRRGGLLTKVGDLGQMGHYLLELAHDPSLRFDMGKTNRERFWREYHPDRIGQMALELYTELVRGPPRLSV